MAIFRKVLLPILGCFIYAIQSHGFLRTHNGPSSFVANPKLLQSNHKAIYGASRASLTMATEDVASLKKKLLGKVKDGETTDVSDLDGKLVCPVSLTPLNVMKKYYGPFPSETYFTSSKYGTKYPYNGIFTNFVANEEEDKTSTDSTASFLSAIRSVISNENAGRELFRSPLVSFLYERGWRDNFKRAGFPGIDAEFEDVMKFFTNLEGIETGLANFETNGTAIIASENSTISVTNTTTTQQTATDSSKKQNSTTNLIRSIAPGYAGGMGLSSGLPPSEMTVLDMSCGSGLMTRRLVGSDRFAQVIAADYSESMLLETYLRFSRAVDGSSSTSTSTSSSDKEKDANVDAKAGKAAEEADTEIDGNKGTGRPSYIPPLYRADVTQLPFASASLDAVHAGAALHCWPEVIEGVREVFRILKPGGKFYATTFLTSGFEAATGRTRTSTSSSSTSSRGRSFRRRANVDGFQYFEMELLREILEKGGFTVEGGSTFEIRREGAGCAIIKCVKSMEE